MFYPIQYLRIRLFPAFLIWCSCLTFISPDTLSASAAPEQLLVFVQTGASNVDATFQDRYLPELRKMAELMGIEIRVVDVRKGVPSDVAITPMIVYQNFRGRSIYQGRTTTLRRIRNFIRTSRFVPQGNAPYLRENIPVWRDGRTQIWAPLKVAPVTGTVPDTYNHLTFVKETRTSIAKGFNSFKIKQKAELGRSDRDFIWTFTPGLSAR